MNEVHNCAWFRRKAAEQSEGAIPKKEGVLF